MTKFKENNYFCGNSKIKKELFYKKFQKENALSLGNCLENIPWILERTF